MNPLGKGCPQRIKPSSVNKKDKENNNPHGGQVVFQSGECMAADRTRSLRQSGLEKYTKFRLCRLRDID